MSLGEVSTPGAVPRVAAAVTWGDQPVIVLATDDVVLTRAVALEVVAASDPRSISSDEVEVIWASDRQLDAERASLELRLAPIFQD